MRSVENPSLRLASCVSVDVVNGGAGRSTPGFCSTDVTVHGTLRAERLDERASSSASSSSRTFAFFSAPVCASKSLPVATRSSPSRDQRGDELAALALETCASRSQYARRAERAPLFLALDDQPDGDALHAAGAQAGLHLLPQHRRQRVAVEPIENAAALLRAHQVLVRRRAGRSSASLTASSVISWKTMRLDGHLRLEHLREVPADRLAFAVGVGREQQLGRVLQRGLEVRDLLPLVARGRRSTA